MDALVEQLLFQAGVDHEARPMLVFSACKLPDPATHNYDELLQQAKLRLDPFVESDYVLIVLSSGAEHRPGWRWLYDAYRELDRKYKKNLKCLYIVHPASWAKVLVEVMRWIVSPKFAQKMVEVKTLSQLASLVPYRKLPIPPAVLEYNATLEAAVTVPDPPLHSPTRVFGISLDQLMGEHGEKGVPKCIQLCIAYIRENGGLSTEGVFRRSPSSLQLKEAKARINEGLDPRLGDFDMSLHIACVLIKMFLRELPTPLFPVHTYPQLESIHKDAESDSDRCQAIRERLPLSVPAKLLLSELIPLWAEIAAAADVTKMPATNLAIVLSPNLVAGPNPMEDLAIGSAVGTVVRCWIEHWSDEFLSHYVNV